MKPLYKGYVLASLLIGPALWTANAQTATKQTTIGTIVTGWASDSFGLMISVPVPNPANCPTTDFPVATLSDPGYKTNYAASLTAWATNSPVTIVVSNTLCSNDRPRIIGLYLQR